MREGGRGKGRGSPQCTRACTAAGQLWHPSSNQSKARGGVTIGHPYTLQWWWFEMKQVVTVSSPPQTHNLVGERAESLSLEVGNPGMEPQVYHQLAGRLEPIRYPHFSSV